MVTELVPVGPSPALPVVPSNAPLVDLVGLITSGMKLSSVNAYVKDFRAFARFTGAPSAEDALLALFRLADTEAAALVLAYQATMLEAKITPATIARRVAALHRAVRRARMVGLTRLNLETESVRTEAFRDVTGPGASGWQKILDQAEAETADGTARSARNVAIVLLLHDRALRRGEVAALDWPADVDLGRPAVAVLGKGKRAKEWLTINAPTRAAIVRYLELRGERPGPLFVRADNAVRADRTAGAEGAGGGGSPGRLDGESVNRLVKALAERAGVGRIVRAHGLRHCGITTALDAGWDVRDVRQFSRHSKVDTVLIYDDRRKDLGGAISRAIGARPRPRGRAGKSTLPGAD